VTARDLCCQQASFTHHAASQSPFATPVFRRLINITRVEVLPPQDSSTRFTPVDLKATGDVFLGVPKLETLVTQPVVAADAVEHELAVQCLLTQGQHHPHLTAIEIGDTRYSLGEAKPDVVFQKV
jgi:hypothetical protein